jgi:GNAT superfamily N-acetyltransferase
MRNEIQISRDDQTDQPTPAQFVERVGSGELEIVARVLAEAYSEDPVFLWAMPKAATRLADATAFFTFYLRRMRSHRHEVFATFDRSAVAVMTPIGLLDRGEPRYLPTLVRTMSPASDYFRWIETFRPNVDHRYLEFIGILPANRSKGRGSLLLGSLLAMSSCEGLPVWCWSSNPRNLTFYLRLGFEAGAELRWDADTPPVTPLWCPAMPVTTMSPAIDKWPVPEK